MAAPQKVLVLDDSETVLEVTQAILEEAGFEVISLSSSALLPRLWSQHRPNLALVDVSMPVVGGETVVELLRRTNLHRCPIVLYSDQPAERLSERVRACGATGFIKKTHDPDELLREVRRYLAPDAVVDVEAKPLLFVIDDDQLQRDVIVDLATAAGWHAVAFARAEDGLAELHRRRPSLVVIDLEMSPMRGDACSRAIRENPAWSDIPILMISGRGTAAEVMQAWRAGVDDFLTKTALKAQLSDKLNVLARISREKQPAIPARGETVLFADRSQFHRARLGRMLECSGYRLVYARTLDEATAATTADGHELSAIVVDGGLLGAEPQGSLRKLRGQAPIFVVAEPNQAVAVGERGPGNRVTVIDKAGPAERLVHALNSEFRRRDGLKVTERVPFFAVVSFRTRDAEEWRSGFSYDLSAGGIFVSTLSPAEEGVTLQLRVEFPGRGVLDAAGVVAWSNTLCPRKTYTYTPGMGVQFTTSSSTFQRALEVYLSSVTRNVGGRA